MFIYGFVCVEWRRYKCVFVYWEDDSDPRFVFSLSLLLNKEIKKGKEIRQVVVQKKKMKSDKCSLFRDFFFLFFFSKSGWD